MRVEVGVERVGINASETILYSTLSYLLTVENPDPYSSVGSTFTTSEEQVGSLAPAALVSGWYVE